MSFSLLTLAILGVTAAIIYKQSRKGHKHGLSRSLIHLATLVFCAVFSALISNLVAELVGKLIFDFLNEKGLFSFLNGPLALLSGVIELLLTMILSVLLYLPVFFITKMLVTRLGKILCAIVMRKIKHGRKKKAPEYLSEEAPFYVRHDKKIGAAVGALSGLILAVIVFMPLTGLLKTSDDIVDTVKEMTYVATLEESAGVQTLDRYANDASATVLRACGGRVLYDLTARTYYEGHSTYLNKEIETIRSMKIVERLKNFKADGQLTASNTQMLTDILNELEQSLCLKLVMVEFVKNASTSWMQYEPYFGVQRPSLGNYEALDSLFDSILFVCSTTTIETYDMDMRTILGLVGILEDYQAIFTNNDYDTFMKEFVEGDALKRIEDELYKNPRMSVLNVAIDDLIINLLTNELTDVIKYDIGQQEALYQGIADILNNAQGLDGSVRMTAISNGVAESFGKHGIYLPPVLEDRVASILVSQFPANEQVTAQSVEQYFAEYTQGMGGN